MKKYWIGILLLISMPAWAIQPYAPTSAEQAMCQARVYSRLDHNNPNSAHMHHYCDGLRFLNRAYAAIGNKQEMGHYLNESINNFDYVLGHTQEDYAMRGEVHMGKARALKLMGKHWEAAAEFTKILRYSPDSPEVYQALADYHQEMGNKPKALEMATEGLRRNPGSQALKRRYTELGGKLPYPEAVAITVPTEATRDEVKEVTSEAAPPSGEATSQATDDANLTAPTGPTPQNDPPKIGSPTNPYCRFCTD
ncbi:TPR repeat-containing protein [Sulfuricella denitrificans skB26]|uniref:TPR repeat-containing protein n=1 Tax=Sulfuricella denitrificans (strain DSM 22764 / NBRC 105220 / skB26) TaxID=1163617 RepID=S6ABH9_SULDS|nr:tetratricopeptide repeat protein [Sulfuricella denitrificans]BAN36770.1 TPR repeat-containing protein [Sulfuricella denitrificans skB26]